MINHRNRPFQNHEHIISIWKSRCYFFSRVVSHSISYKFRRKMSRSCRLIVLHYHSARGCLNYCLESFYWRTPKCWLASIRCYIFSRVVFHSIIYKFRRKMSRSYRYVHYLNSAHGLLYYCSKTLSKIFAQPYTILGIQFLDREKGDKNNDYPWEYRFVLQ